MLAPFLGELDNQDAVFRSYRWGEATREAVTELPAILRSALDEALKTAR